MLEFHMCLVGMLIFFLNFERSTKLVQKQLWKNYQIFFQHVCYFLQNFKGNLVEWPTLAHRVRGISTSWISTYAVVNGLKPSVDNPWQQWKVTPKIPYRLGNLVGAESFAHCQGMERVPKQTGISSAWCGALPSCSPAPAQNDMASRALVAPFLLPHPTILWVGQHLLRSCCALHRFSSLFHLQWIWHSK